MANSAAATVASASFAGFAAKTCPSAALAVSTLESDVIASAALASAALA